MINNPFGLYGGGAFRVDSSAAVNYYLKRQAEEKAKQDALDKYFSHLTDKASATGLRTDKEGPAFQQSIKNAQTYYIQNKKAITGGDIAAQQKYIELTNIPFQIMAASKDALATAKIAAQMGGQMGGTNKTARERWTDETIGIDAETGKPLTDANGGYMGLYAHDQSTHNINPDGSVTPNPKFKMFDPMSIKLNPEILNAKQLQDYVDNGLTVFKPSEISSQLRPDPKKPGYEVPVTIKGYTQESLKSQADAIKNLTSDPAVKATINKLYPYQTWPLQNQTQFEAANKVYNNLYGKDIGNNSELFTALQIAPRAIQTEEYGTPKLSDIAGKELDLKYQKKFESYKKSIDPALMTNADNTELGFERITPGTYGNVQIDKKGKVRNADGTLYTSPSGQPSVEIPLSALNTEIIKEFPSGTKIKSISGIKAIVENGIIKYAAIKGKVPGKDYGTIDRTSLYNTQFSKNAAPILINNVPSTQKSTPKTTKKGALNNLQ